MALWHSIFNQCSILRMFALFLAICLIMILWLTTMSLMPVDDSNSHRFWTVRILNNTCPGPKCKVMESHEWAIQFNVLLKSVNIVSKHVNEPMIVEALVIVRQGVTLDSLRCVIKTEPDNHLIFLRVNDSIAIYTDSIAIWRIKCHVPIVLREQITLADRVLTAVVDYGNFVEKETHSHAENLLLKFHRPLIFDNEYVSKKRAVAHCVHTIRDVDAISLKRLTDWLLIQREIGYAHIKLYFLDAHMVDRAQVQALLRTSNAHFRVDLVKYMTSVADNCDWMQNISQSLYSECQSLVASLIPRSNLGIHEKMCTNDCYFKLRHSYAYLTNYDFDELLFPRHMPVDDFAPLFDARNTSSCLQPISSTVKYDIYTYAERLVAKYERGLWSRRVAALHFEHFLAMPIKNENAKNDLEVHDIINEHGEINFRLNGRLVTTSISSNADVSSVQMYKKLIALTQCLINNTRIKNFDRLWTSPFLLRVDGRYGKSLIVTDFTETLNQHGPDTIAPNSQFKFVSFEDGISSHYRKSGYEDFKFRFPLSSHKMHFEIELFLMLLGMDKKHNINMNSNSSTINSLKYVYM